MNFKEAKKEGVKQASKTGRRYRFLTISKQVELGWFVETVPNQRSVFVIYKNGDLSLIDTDFAKNYQKKYFPNIKLVKSIY